MVGSLALLTATLAVPQAYVAVRNLGAARHLTATQAATAAILEAARLTAAERGMTNAALSAVSADAPARNAAAASRDQAVQATTEALASARTAGLDIQDLHTKLQSLDMARKAAWAGLDGTGPRSAPDAWFRVATSTIDAMLTLMDQLGDALPATADTRMMGSLALAGHLAQLSEHLGRARGLLAGVLTAGRPLTPAQIEAVGKSDGAAKLSLASADAYAARQGAAVATALAQAQASLDTVDALRTRVMAASTEGVPYPVDAATWFKTVTDAITQVTIARREVESETRAQIGRLRATAFLHLLTSLGLVSLCAVVVVASLWVVVNQLLRPLDALRRTITRFAVKDYSVEVPGLERKDEIGEMATAVASLRENAQRADVLAEEQRKEALAKEARRQRLETATREFASSIDQVVSGFSAAEAALRNAAGDLTSSADDTLTLSSTVAGAAEETSANVQTVASAAEQLSQSINEIAHQMAQATDTSVAAVRETTETKRSIDSLANAAQRIGQVISLIEDIAQQTNMLALNATIEAARAGEAGRGFAVVAGEVKALASQTAKATEDIQAQVHAIQKETAQAVAAIDGIALTIGNMSEITTTVASAVEQQGAATREIARNVQQASAGTRAVSANIAGVRQAADGTGCATSSVVTSSDALGREADTLKSVVSRFLTSVNAA
ncbi:methyl-accepting chemotaxis protein [Azospirillum sp. B4]|uniref:methyl-accepting chemotaxis protein n=1 Tax=Azospirillum sp. B4 TaxID=95605 RepID=UPI00131EDF0C|nr:HAMP domain-containing methyl-accepting chemotaxis protein [Azospirillum sp. B4]